MKTLKMELVRFVRKHGSTILAIAASAGVVTTSICVAKATVKTVEELNEAENQMDISEGRELTKKEKAAIAIPNYIPSGMMACGTIMCILGGEILNKNTQRNLSAAYMALDAAYSKYRQHVIDIYGVSADEEVIRSIALDAKRPELVEETGTEIFYDEYSDIMFESNLNVIERAASKFNMYLSDLYSVDLNVFYEECGHPGLPFYQYIHKLPNWDGIRPELSKAIDDDGLEYWSISLNLPTASTSGKYFDYIWR